MQRINHLLLMTIVTFSMAVSPIHADIIRGDDPPQITDIYDDLDEWLDAVPPVTVIDFTDFPGDTIITDQYADLGVNFVDGLYFIRTYPKTALMSIREHVRWRNPANIAVDFSQRMHKRR